MARWWCAQVAAVLAAQGKKVGLVDMDLCGTLLVSLPV
jgi:Mrp family chromosome partitioning ATPase